MNGKIINRHGHSVQTKKKIMMQKESTKTNMSLEKQYMYIKSNHPGVKLYGHCKQVLNYNKGQ